MPGRVGLTLPTHRGLHGAPAFAVDLAGSQTPVQTAGDELASQSPLQRQLAIVAGCLVGATVLIT